MKIGIGTKVNIHFTLGRSLFAVKIIAIPYDVGDCWTVVDNYGNEHKVILFEHMEIAK